MARLVSFALLVPLLPTDGRDLCQNRVQGPAVHHPALHALTADGGASVVAFCPKSF